MNKRETLSAVLDTVWFNGTTRDKGMTGTAILKDVSAILKVLDYNVRIGTPIAVGKDGNYIEYPIWLDNTQFFIVISRPTARINWAPYVGAIEFEWDETTLVKYHPEYLDDNESA